MVCKVRMTGTQRGQPIMPGAFNCTLAGVTPTGRAVDVPQFHSFRIRGDEISEHAAVRDDFPDNESHPVRAVRA